MSAPIDQTLVEHGGTYGDFRDHAQITQCLKQVMQQSPNWREKKLKHMHMEALEMIAHKIWRILNGDPDYADSWHDIADYAKLVEDRLPGSP